VDQDVVTTSLPVGVYTTAAMDDATAYRLTQTFWGRKSAMAKNNAWWKGVSPEGLNTLGAKLHTGAVKYYKESGVSIPDNLL